MIKLENISVYNVKNAIRGMRNPMNSWELSDSSYGDDYYHFYIGKKDEELAKKLIKAGTDHRKFLRQIFVSIDITAPLYWWKQMDQYRVGAVTNSTSTMHKLTSKPLSISDDFSIDDIDGFMLEYVEYLNRMIEQYKSLENEETKKRVWRNIIQRLPDSYNQTRTWTGNYEILRNIYFARKDHKLNEWRNFCIALSDESKFPFAEFISE